MDEHLSRTFEALGPRLRQLRSDRNVTLTELAEETGYEASEWREIGRMSALNGLARAPEHVFLATGLRRPGADGEADASHETRLEEGISAVSSVPWAEAESVQVRSNNAGQALLQVEGARGSAYLPLVAVDVGGDRTQSPEFLTLLADEVERWAPQRGAVVKQLRAQADHVASGGSVRESPIARAHLARSR